MTNELIERLSAQEAPAPYRPYEHPDETALRVTLQELRERLGPQGATDFVNRLHNRGIVLRMAQWWIENHGSGA